MKTPPHPLIEKLKISLVEDDTGPNRRKWAEHIVENKIPLLELLPILDVNDTAAMRFTWLLGDISELDATVLNPIVLPLYKKRNTIEIVNFDRTVAALLNRSGIPKEVEGEAIDTLFKWLNDPKITIMTKSFAMSALVKATKTHPDLKNELILSIKDQLGNVSNSFNKRAEKVLKDLV